MNGEDDVGVKHRRKKPKLTSEQSLVRMKRVDLFNRHLLKFDEYMLSVLANSPVFDGNGMAVYKNLVNVLFTDVQNIRNDYVEYLNQITADSCSNSSEGGNDGRSEGGNGEGGGDGETYVEMDVKRKGCSIARKSLWFLFIFFYVIRGFL